MEEGACFGCFFRGLLTVGNERPYLCDGGHLSHCVSACFRRTSWCNLTPRNWDLQVLAQDFPNVHDGGRFQGPYHCFKGIPVPGAAWPQTNFTPDLNQIIPLLSFLKFFGVSTT